jgi:hypothetical protein
MIKVSIAGFIFIAALLALSHPTPFRVPDYLAKRARVPDTLKEGDIRETFGNFNGDSDPLDRAYVAQLQVEGRYIVEIRFNHLIPILQLSDKYERIVHLEQPGDLNNDGADDLYFIAVERGSCSAVGIVTALRNGRWTELQTVRQYGCVPIIKGERKLARTENGFYYISYAQNAHGDEHRFRGTIK